MIDFSFDEAAATEEAGSTEKLGTGVVDFKDLTVSQVIASTGTSGFDISFIAEGQKYKTTIYGIWTHKKDGTPIFNWNTIQGLMGIVGAKTLTFFDKEIEIKNGKKTVKAVKEFDGKSGKVALQKILDEYNGEVTEKLEVRAFFGSDGKTYAEKTKNSEAKQIVYYSKKLKDKETDKYKKLMADAPKEDKYDSDNDSGIL